MRWLLGFVFLLLALGTLRTVGCGEASPCGDCNDGDPCTIDECRSRRVGQPPGMCEPDERPVDFYCLHRDEPDGTPCGSGNVCVDGVCGENPCADCEDDGNSCTTDCDYSTGACDYVRLPDGESCEGKSHSGRCYGGVCIVCEELDCNDGDLCTNDGCGYPEGCWNVPVFCYDGDRCAVCDPETGECSDALGEGLGCVANRELGIDGTYLFGSCESGRCTGQPCDVTSEEVYPCPVEDATSSVEWICCPWEHLPYYPRGYCTTDGNCDRARLLGICAAECPNTESNPRRYDECWGYADGDCALVDYCHAECASYPTACMSQDGVCPSP